MENEKRLIDANRLRFEASRLFRKDSRILDEIDSLVCLMPTVEAVEVKHGRWNIDKSFMPFISTCSQCGATYTVDGAFDWNYCPHCGAKMDGDQYV